MLVPFRDDWRNFPCADWPGRRDQKGYGRISLNGEGWRMHRWAWTQINGPIPDGYQVMHACDRPPCYMLEHLGVGTNKDNVDDKMSKGRYGKGSAKLCESDVINIKYLLSLPANERITLREIAFMYNVSEGAISEIRAGRNWQNIGTEMEMTYGPSDWQSGSKNNQAKLTESDVINIKSMLALPKKERPTQQEIGDMYGITFQTVSAIKLGKLWSHIKLAVSYDV